jgi:hypothetical protein
MDGENSIYKLPRGRERKTGDLDQVKCIKEADTASHFYVVENMHGSYPK